MYRSRAQVSFSSRCKAQGCGGQDSGDGGHGLESICYETISLLKGQGIERVSVEAVVNQPGNPTDRSRGKHEGNIRYVQHNGERASQLVARCSPARHFALYDMLHINTPVFHVDKSGAL